VRSLDPKNALKVIIRPYITEKTYDIIEKHNRLVFIVDRTSSKKVIKNAIETLYEVKIESINTVNTIIGKKAYVRLQPKHSAVDLASKLGLV